MGKIFRYSIMFVVILGLFSTALAQQTITPEEAGKYIGRQKTVCGTVVSAYYATQVKGKPTFLNLDKSFLDHVFTVVIWGADRSGFEKPPETLYAGKEICVTGTIQTYQGLPDIIVKKPSQIKVK